MQERLIELLMELHRDTPRQGPGERRATLKALDMCAGLPGEPDILDVGCGSGAQTLHLAEATRGRITATDINPPFLDQLGAAVRAKGLEHRITTLRADIGDLPLAPASFDLVWCEGAVFVVGFDRGLALWRGLLRPGGCLVLSELTWHTRTPSSETKAYFGQWCPEMRDVRGNLAACRQAGYEVLGHFTLGARGWSEEYYAPLRTRLPAFRRAHPGDEVAAVVTQMTEEQMDLFERFNREYGYEFYVLRRED
ncbi:class I SAM-dependent methyltransferase [Desulfocurvus sp. DL9XJH121]